MTRKLQVINSQPEGIGVASSPVEQYEAGVRNEIRLLRKYFARRITQYRVVQTVVIVSAALVPVLAAISVVPRWVLAVFGALAVAAEGIQGLYQLRSSALDAMRTANSLERVLNKYMVGVAPYEGPRIEVFPRFANDIESIRETADKAFLQTWTGAGGRKPAIERGSDPEQR